MAWLCGTNKHTKQLHSKNSAQFYVVRPIYMQHLPYLRAIKGHLRTYGRPTEGQTAENRAKPSPPSRSLPTQFKSRPEAPMAQRVL
jgi:hypothetical protein